MQDSINQNLHEVAITAIVVKDGKYLITKRSKTKKRFPGFWIVPGGKLEKSDYENLPKDSTYQWYNVLERTLKREVKEEVGIEINNLEYLTSITTIYDDGTPSLIISAMADYVSGDIKLQEGEIDEFVWVTLEEAKKYQLIDGIYDELIMAENKRKGQKSEWKRF